MRARRPGLLLLVAVLSACSSSTEIGTRDAGAALADAAKDASELLTQLQRSRAAWDAAVAAMGDTYSYAEENCTVNALTHRVTTVQVREGQPQLFAVSEIPGDQCQAQVNRYEDFVPKSMPALYDVCEALVQREPASVTLQLDKNGLLKGCTADGPTDCRDNCGEGFYLRALIFGQLEVP